MRAHEAAVEPHVFLETMTPLLQTRDCTKLADCLENMGGADRIVPLLDCNDEDVRKVAALSLALVGDDTCVEPLLGQLRHEDPMINQMAEHALWSIWFRGGTPQANHAIARGTEAMNAKRLCEAEACFTEAIDLCPNFAEAYNQRSIVRYLLERHDASMADCRQVVRLMPSHFGAWAGLGHCHAECERFSEAIRCYREALAINPHLSCVSELVHELETCSSATGAEDDAHDDVT